MYVLGGICAENGVFKLPVFSQGAQISFCAGDKPHFGDFELYGHIYRFSLPNKLSLVRKTNCKQYLAKKEWRLTNDTLLKTLLSVYLLKFDGVNAVSEFCCECAENLNHETRASDTLARKVDWYVHFYDRLAVPSLTVDSDSTVVRSSKNMRSISGFGSSSWFSAILKTAKNAIDTHCAMVVPLNIADHSYAIQAIPTQALDNGVLRSYCLIYLCDADLFSSVCPIGESAHA